MENNWEAFVFSHFSYQSITFLNFFGRFFIFSNFFGRFFIFSNFSTFPKWSKSSIMDIQCSNFWNSNTSICMTYSLFLAAIGETRNYQIMIKSCFSFILKCLCNDCLEHPIFLLSWRITQFKAEIEQIWEMSIWSFSKNFFN